MLDQNMNSIISFLVELINGLFKLMGIDFELKQQDQNIV